MRDLSTFPFLCTLFFSFPSLHACASTPPLSIITQSALPAPSGLRNRRTQSCTSSLRWIKAVLLPERVSKSVLLDSEDASEHTCQWTAYNSTRNSKLTRYLESNRYNVPGEIEETKVGLKALIRSCGEDGALPADKKLGAVFIWREEGVIPLAVVHFVS